MTTPLLQMQTSALQIHEQLEYPESGLRKKVLFKDDHCQYTLICLAAGADIAEHSTPRNATVQVLAGRGELTISGQHISLEPGVFVVMPANEPHALNASENLAFLLTFH
ncbi:MAG: cupin domain-containing protein [Leptolyngbya foveolarum]|uniref:Cupin domain-containing protein n=1 Tax=Leptolyngbya foveolarum TaxID=47253 RepID=A0A2W4U4B7_9CYAN|nr:MAG: cupin domain-containing protein [Leptolyngbya foveolarum]